MTVKYLLGIFVIIYIISIVLCDDKTDKVSTTTTPAVFEGEDNNIVVHFMDLKRKEFIAEIPKLEAAIFEIFGNFCDTNELCSKLDNVGNYSIGFVGSTDKERYQEDNRYIITKLFLKYLDSNDQYQYVPKNILSEFFTSLRDSIVKGSSIDIAYINNKFVYPMRDNLDNYIIIPISLAFLLTLVIFNFVCQRKSDKLMREAFLRQFQKKNEPEQQNLLSSGNSNSKNEIIQMNQRKSNNTLNKSNKSSESFLKDNNNNYDNIKTSDKRKKRRTAEHVAGKVTESIGSSRNIADACNKWTLTNEGSNSTEMRKKICTFEDSNYGFSDNNAKYQPKYVSSELNSERKRRTNPNTPSQSTYNFEYPDARVAQRLASYERLPSTYDNVKLSDEKKGRNSSSTKNIDL